MPDFYPSYIFGMHDRGGEHLMLDKTKPGWVLVTEALGADPNNHAGSDYTDLSVRGWRYRAAQSRLWLCWYHSLFCSLR